MDPETGQRYTVKRYDSEKANDGDSWRQTRVVLARPDQHLRLAGSRSFLLATAAYNAGEGRIIQCLRQLGDPFQERSFWQIRG